MNRIQSYLLLIIGCSCSNSTVEVVSGELMTNIRHRIDFKNASSTEINNYINNLDSIAVNTNSRDLKLSAEYYHNLLKYDLIRSPSIVIKKDNDSLVQVFINKDQYEKIREYDYLGSEIKNKVDIKLRYIELDNFIFLSDSILEIRVKNLK